MDVQYKWQDLKDKKILITGGLGFIGSNLAIKCVESGAKVTIMDSLEPHSGGNLYNIHDIKDSIELIFSDILDFKEVTHAIYNKDIIFNCAASTSHPFSMREPLIDLEINSKGVINLLEAARRFNKSIKFIHIGTSTQLGQLQYSPADENHPEFPKDIYSANKCASEKYVQIYGNAFGLNTTVIRLSNVFGPRASIHSAEFTFNNYFIGLALKEQIITIFGDGKQLRNLIYIDDVIAALLLVSTANKPSGEVFFVVGDKHYSVHEIAKTIIKIFGTGDIALINWPIERKVTDVGDAVITNKKFKTNYDWNPVINLEEGLIRTKDYYKTCLAEYL
jgi:UDP-glucose 4-epimerase